MNRFVIHKKGFAMAEGEKVVPVKMLIGGEWVQVGEGTYDEKNHTVDVKIDEAHQAHPKLSDIMMRGFVGGFSLGYLTK